MRTTLTLDDDVAALVRRLRQERRLGLKEVVNEALRRGLREMVEAPRRRALYRTRAVQLGRCLVGSIDDVSEALAAAEGEEYR
jgi:hypothetical protein